MIADAGCEICRRDVAGVYICPYKFCSMWVCQVCIRAHGIRHEFCGEFIPNDGLRTYVPEWFPKFAKELTNGLATPK